MTTVHTIRQRIFAAMPVNREVTRNDMMHRMGGKLPPGFGPQDMSANLSMMVKAGSIQTDTIGDFTVFKRTE